MIVNITRDGFQKIYIYMIGDRLGYYYNTIGESSRGYTNRSV